LIIAKYKHALSFYALSTLILWAFWFTDGFVSHIVPCADRYLKIASVLGFIGLLSPMGVLYWLISNDPELRSDISKRLLNVKPIKPLYTPSFTCFLMLASILLAQAISLLFGYTPSQFVITGHFTFSSGIFPVWFMLLIAPVIEELAWNSYGTDCLCNKMNLCMTSLLFGVFWGIWHLDRVTLGTNRSGSLDMCS
jgi:hypothetical protein